MKGDLEEKHKTNTKTKQDDTYHQNNIITLWIIEWTDWVPYFWGVPVVTACILFGGLRACAISCCLWQRKKYFKLILARALLLGSDFGLPAVTPLISVSHGPSNLPQGFISPVPQPRGRERGKGMRGWQTRVEPQHGRLMPGRPGARSPKRALRPDERGCQKSTYVGGAMVQIVRPSRLRSRLWSIRKDGLVISTTGPISTSLTLTLTPGGYIHTNDWKKSPKDTFTLMNGINN